MALFSSSRNFRFLLISGTLFSTLNIPGQIVIAWIGMPGYTWALPKLWPGAQGTKTYMTYAGKNCPWNYHVKNKNNKH